MLRTAAFWLLTIGTTCAVDAPTYLDDAQTDAQGILWACNQTTKNQLYRFDGRQWTLSPVPFDPSESATPALLVRMKDGTMACVWGLSDHRVAVTGHTATGSKVLGMFDGETSPDGIRDLALADSQNRLWITGEFPGIYRLDATGLKPVHQMAPEEYRNYQASKSGFNVVHAAEDGHGRIWVWCDPFASNCASLREVLIFTGDTAERHDTFSTIPAKSILAIARADDRQMWLAVAKDGLYKVDIDTFAVERVPDPAPKVFVNVHEIHVDGGDVYAVASGPGAGDSLWRLRNGTWQELAPSFDLSRFSLRPRSWLPLKSGILVTANGCGPWFVPKEGGPAMLSWRSGFPIEDAHALDRLADGSFFALGRGSGFFHGALELPPKDKSSRVTEIEPGEQPWTFSKNNHAWTMSMKPPIALKEWDGSKWTVHELPAGSDESVWEGIYEDDQGRIWVLGKTIDLFNPHTQTWESFPDRETAFLAQKDKPVQLYRDRWVVTPQYSADHRRVAFRRGVDEIHYYDGTRWQTWKRADLTGQKESDLAVGPPWFDENGKLRVNIRPKASWQMDDTGKWTSVPFTSHFPEDIWSEGGNNQFERPVPPEGCVTNEPESIVVDNLGTTWLTWQGDLYKCIPGFCVKVFGPKEVDPFRSPRQLREVEIDTHGNAFVLSASQTMNRFMIRPKSSAPKTTVRLVRRNEDSFIAHFDTHAQDAAVFRWQLDDGPWQLSRTKSVPLDHEGNGPHVVRVTAIDDELNMDASPVEAKFEVKIDPTRQIALLIAQLRDPDYDRRKEAVAALAQQPDLAKAALEAAREGSGEDDRWWIDAALQAIENEKATRSGAATGPGSP